MVYHSTPDPNKTYPDHMTNFELTRFEISKVFYTADGLLIDHIETTAKTYQTIEMSLTRTETIDYMRQQGNGFYYEGKKLILDTIGLDRFIHFEKSPETRDILE